MLTSRDNTLRRCHFCLCLARCNSSRTSKQNFIKFGIVLLSFVVIFQCLLKLHDNGPEYLEVPADIHTLPIECCALLAKYLSERNAFKKSYVEK
jgi:hypothetical protein